MRHIICLITLYLFSFGLSAQNGTIAVNSEYNSGSIKLRWSFEDYQSFQKFREYGITVKRQIFEKDHVVFSYQQQIQSEVIIIENLKPQSEAWMSTNLSGDDATVLRNLLYGNLGDDVIDYQNPKLSDAATKEKVDKMKVFMTLFVSGKDFNLSQAAGLGLVDNEVRSNHAYRYILTVQDNSGNNLLYPQYYTVDTYVPDTYPPLVIKSENGYSSINIIWPRNEDKPYISYDIYRSPAGQNNFVKINDNPFTYFQMSGNTTDDIIFRDSLLQNTSWDYKIKARTVFGSYTDFSNTVNAKSLVIPRNNLGFKNLDPDITDQTVQLNWELPSSENNYVTHFNVYRSPNQDDGYIQLNQSPIPSSDRKYTDFDPLDEGFYIIEALSTDFNFYRTVPIYAQKADSIPPAPPVGLYGKYEGKSQAVLSWSPNSEEDIAGYRILVGDAKNGNFIQVTTDMISTTQYLTYMDPSDARDSTYFKVIAIDKRGNYSAASASFGMKKPNNVRPAKPSLTVVKPDKKGIGFKWKFSSSVDVVVHKLERKMEGTPDWTTVVDIPTSEKENFIPADSTAYNYIDSSSLEQRPYQYRLIAVNDQYTTATSDMMTVTPMPPVLSKNNIQNFALEKEVLPSATNPLVQLELNNLRRVNPQTASRFIQAADILNIKVKWTCNLDPSVQDFQVYRSITGSTTSLYRTISLAEAMGFDPNTQEIEINEDMGPVNLAIKDKNLLSGRRYTYQVMARYKDQSTTKLSNSLSLKL